MKKRKINLSKLKKERGSISLFVLVAMIFFLVIITSLFMFLKDKLNNENKQIEQIQAEYAGYLEDIDKIYADLTKDLLEISLFTEDGKAYNTNQWTNQNVIAKIYYPESTDESDILVSSDNGATFKAYTGDITITQNTIVIAKIVNGKSKKAIIDKIDKTMPTYTTLPSNKNFMLGNDELARDVSLTIIANDDDGSGIENIQYYLSRYDNIEPTDWIDATNNEEFTINNCRKGTYYLWVKVEDVAGNIFKNSEKVRVIEPIAKIGTNVYGSIQEAINDVPRDGTQITIELLKDTTEVASTYANQNIIFDLQGHNVSNNYSDKATFTNNANLTIIDTNEEAVGTISSSLYVGIQNNENATLTLGINDDDVSRAEPMINSKTVGIQNNGTFNFYDGTVTSTKAILGHINDTPRDFKTISVLNGNIETAYLGILADPAARIGDIYYGTLNAAVGVARPDDVVSLVRGNVLGESLEIPADKEITLNLDGNILSTTVQDYVIKNYGKLVVTNEQAEGSIVSSTYHTILNDMGATLEVQSGTIELTLAGTTSDYKYVIQNYGNIITTGGIIQTSKNYTAGISNQGGNIETKGGNITVSGTNTIGIRNGDYTYIPEDENAINLMDSTIVNNGSYYFVKNGNTLVPNNIGVNSGIANSYIEIDLTDKEGIYDLIINAKVSSQSGYDYGYATITKTTTAPAYNSSTGRLIYISGEVASTDYTTTLVGGEKYYLHLGYRKNGSSNTGEDKITFNKIELLENTTNKAKITINGGNLKSSSYYTIYNVGVGDIDVNNGIIEGSYGIYNNAIANVNINGGTFTSSYGVYNNNIGTVVIKEGIFGGSYAVYNNNTGTVVLEGGTLTGIRGIYNYNKGNVEIKDATIILNNSANEAIYNRSEGKINVSNSTIIGEIYNYNKGDIKIVDSSITGTIDNYNGTVTINNSNITNTSIGINNGIDSVIIGNNVNINVDATSYKSTVYGIYNSGIATIENLNIDMKNISTTSFTSNNSKLYGVYNYGTKNVKITGGNINVSNNSTSTSSSYSSYTYGIYNYSTGTVEINNIKINSLGSESSNYGYGRGVENNSTGSITIGTKDSNIDNEKVEIIGKDYGIYNTVGTINFYDGIIKGKFQAIYEIITDIEEDSQIKIYGDEDYQAAIVTKDKVMVARVESTGIEYSLLQDAVNFCTNSTEETVTILQDLYLINETLVEESKDIKLNLNGKTILSGNNIINKGTLEIIDNSNNEKVGEIRGTNTIYNEKGNFKISSGKINNIASVGIKNIGGEVEVVGGEIESTTSNTSYGIYNENAYIDIKDKIQNNGTYYFEKTDEGLVSNNSKKNATTANSYVEIDLTEETESKIIRLIATTTSENSSYNGYGYATITESTDAPTYNQTEGRIMYTSSIQTNSKYYTQLEGGKKYYLHIGFYSRTSSYDSSMKITEIGIEDSKGMVDIIDGKVTSSKENSYGINNIDGNVNIEGGTIVGSTYGIYNINMGMVQIVGGNISAGIYNRDEGLIQITGGIVNGKGYGINNGGMGKIEIVEGIVNGSTYGIYNYNKGIIKVIGGTINSSITAWNGGNSYGIYNDNEGIIEIIGGTINSNNSVSYYDSYGIYNKSTAKINIKGGTISSNNRSRYTE